MNSSSSRESQRWEWLRHWTNSSKTIVLMRYQIKLFQAASGDQAIVVSQKAKIIYCWGGILGKGRLPYWRWAPGAQLKPSIVVLGGLLFCLRTSAFMKGFTKGFHQESRGLLEAVSSFSYSILLFCLRNANFWMVPYMPFPEAMIRSIVVDRPLLFPIRPSLVLLPCKERLMVMPMSLKDALPSPQAPASWSSLSTCFAYS